MKIEFSGNISIEADLVCETGIHIGTQALGISLSRSDNPIVKLDDDVPYIPGSSIKGKIRSLLEVSEKKDMNIDIGPEERDARHECDLDTLCEDLKSKGFEAEMKEDERKEIEIKKNGKSAKIYIKGGEPEIEGELKEELRKVIEELPFPCDICVIFGRGAERKGSEGPTRIQFEDCFIDPKNQIKDPIEIKWENVINRLTSSAVPRDIERIKKGTVFKLKATYHIFSEDLDGEGDIEKLQEIQEIEQLPAKLKRRIKLLSKGMELLEKNYLGGMGSRGYGKVRVENLTMRYYPKSFFEGKGEVKTIANAKNVMEIIKRLC